MRSQLFASVVAVSLAFGASAYAQAPKPATGSTGSTGAAKPATGAPASTGQPAKPATGAPASTGQAAKPATGAPASTGQAAKPAPSAPAPAAQPPAKPTPAPAAPTATPPPATPPATQPPPPPPPSSNPAAAGSAAQPSAPQPLPPPSSDAYSYLPEGRRDPFLNLIGGGGNDKALISNVKLGPAGMSVAEIQVRGVMQSHAGLLAMILGPDNKTYIVHQGDKLLDGTIKQITPQGLVILQEVTDPLSLVKQREVRKLLRSLEDAK